MRHTTLVAVLCVLALSLGGCNPKTAAKKAAEEGIHASEVYIKENPGTVAVALALCGGFIAKYWWQCALGGVVILGVSISVYKRNR